MTDLPHPQSPLIRRPPPVGGGPASAQVQQARPLGRKEVAAKKAPSRKPVLTWAAAALPLLFILPITAMGAWGADPRGPAGNLAILALYAVPVGGLLCLTGAVERKERAFPVRALLFAIHGLWLLGLGFLLLVSAMFGMGDNW